MRSIDMLSIFLNWSYMLVTLFCMGFAFSRFSARFLNFSLKRMDTILFAGLVIATCYAQIFSLFYRVNVEANIVMLLFCAVAIMLWHRQMFDFLRMAFRISVPRKILIGVLFVVWCYFTSRGYMVPDTDLYHAQSIRWIEEYGVVKGLGNLHFRFAYNSALFALSALYSMRFLLGHSLHAVNGLMAFTLCLELLNLGKCFQRKKMLLSDFARCAAVYYLTLIADELVAPSSDYAVMIVLFFLIIKWLDCLENPLEENETAPYSLLCVMGVFALTLKLTAGLILILLIKPAFTLLHRKQWKEILCYLTMGLLVAAPWMSRTVIISGWLLYPFPALDLFSFDWKMTNIEEIKIDAAMIKMWARAANSTTQYVALKQWFPHWFAELSATEKVVIVGDFLSCVVFVGMGIRTLLKKKWGELNILLVLLTLTCSYLYWQFTAPMFRYGYAHTLLLVALTAGCLFKDTRVVCRMVYCLILLFGIYKLWVCVGYVRSSYWYDCYVWQKDYGSYDLTASQLDGVVIYTTTYFSGYDSFPACDEAVLQKIELRGDGLKDGFRLK